MTTLKKKILITAEIIVKTGLHVGGTNSSLNIGGPDKFVVRNPLTNKPYIPGSSIKGKMRSLLELMDGTIHPDNNGGYGPTKKEPIKLVICLEQLAISSNQPDLSYAMPNF